MVFTLIPFVFIAEYVDYFTEAKWVFLYGATGVLLIVTSLTKKEFIIPRLQTWQIAVVLALVVIFLQNTTRFGWLFQGRVVLDRILFCIWAWIFFLKIRETPKFLMYLSYSLLVSAVLVTTIGLLQCSGVVFSFLPSGYSGNSASFGHVNYTAEYLAYAIVFFLVFHKDETRFYRRLLFEISTAAAVAYVIHLNCRAVFLGLIASLVYLVIFARVLPKLAFVRVCTLSFLLYAAPTLLQSFRQQIQTVPVVHNPVTSVLAKGTATIHERFFIWQDLLATTLANPAGIGPGNFAFGHLLASGKTPHSEIREFFFWHHPHNEFLRFLVEDGWLFTGLLSILYCSLIWTSWRKYRATQQGSTEYESLTKKWKLLVSLGLILLTSGGFSFPLYLPFSFLVAALLTALLFTLQKERLVIKPKFYSKMLLTLVLCIAFLNLAGRVDLAEYVAKNRLNSEADTDLACRMLPHHWPVCLAAAQANIDHNHFDAAKAKLDRILQMFPFHYPALRTQAFLAAQQGNGFDECMSLWAYDAILRNPSSMTERKNAVCSHEFLQEITRSSLSNNFGTLARLRR